MYIEGSAVRQPGSADLSCNSSLPAADAAATCCPQKPEQVWKKLLCPDITGNRVESDNVHFLNNIYYSTFLELIKVCRQYFAEIYILKIPK